MNPISASAASLAPPSEATKLPDIMRQVRSVVDDSKSKITTSLNGFVKAALEIADQLQASGVGPVANYARQGAEMVTAWSTSLNTKSLEDLVGDARTFVRAKPKAAIGIGLVAGFVVSRLFKVGSDRKSVV